MRQFMITLRSTNLRLFNHYPLDFGGVKISADTEFYFLQILQELLTLET